MTGYGNHISNLAKLLVRVRTACLSTLVHWMFLCEHGFWQINRFVSCRLTEARSTMQKLVERLNRYINLEWLSIYPCEDTTEKTSLRSASNRDLRHTASTKHSSTSISARADSGANGKGLENVWINYICANWWRNWFDWKFVKQRYRNFRGGAEEERQSPRVRTRVEAARQTGCSEDG